MPSRRRLRLTAAAEADLREILQYARERWGDAQLQAYAATLEAFMRRWADFPGLGRSRDEMAAGLRSHAVGQHTIFYRLSDHGLVIERIIHQARDVVHESPGPTS